MKIKINFIGTFQDNKYEGFIKIVNELKNRISNSYLIKINSKNNKKFDLINIHSAGFLSAIKYKKTSQPAIYSLHANFGSNFLEELKDQFDLNKYIIDNKYTYNKDYGNIFKKLLIRLISISTPIWIKRRFLKKFDLVIVNNKFMKNKLKLNNVKVIYHGIDFNKYKIIKTKKKTKKIKIAYFGHLASNKGIIEAVNAFSKINNCDKYIYTTTKSKKFKNYVKSLDSSIILKGYVKDIVKEYNSCDIIILPFRNETSAIATPLVLIEAMACGVPIITTNLPHIREYCENSVFYVPPKNEKKLKLAINKLISDKRLRNKYKSKARAQVLKNHKIEDMITNYEKIYSSFNSLKNKKK